MQLELAEVALCWLKLVVGIFASESCNLSWLKFQLQSAQVQLYPAQVTLMTVEVATSFNTIC
jgi:hypothetical protein